MSAETFNWPIDASDLKITDGFPIHSVRHYYWEVVVGGILAFAMAWGIGANDVANAFATSVGAGSITLPMACFLAAIMEFTGAVLLGGNVTSTVRSSILNTSIFDPNNPEGASNGPEMLMTGFLVALLCATIWLVLATYLNLPVSTTHSIIGSLVGVGLAYRGTSAVVWFPSEGSFGDRLKGMVGVILSWVISPILSAFFAIIFFLIVRHLVLRRKNPFAAGLAFIPIFYGFTLAMAIFFIVYKGDGRFDLAKRLGSGAAVGVAFGGGAVFAILSIFVLVPIAKRYVERWESREQEKEKNPEAVKEEDESKSKAVTNALGKIGVNMELKEELSDDILQMHDNVEKFDPKTERLFTWVQVFTAAVDSFAHGANDVANAIAPFTSVFQLYWGNGVLSGKKTGTFERDGNYSGGPLNGDTFKFGDSLPDHEAYCGTDGETEYFACAEDPVFPYTSVTSETDGISFPIYNSTGHYQDSNGTCYTGCNHRNYAAYKDKKQNVPIWILAMGGAGIVAGLSMWGYRIIMAIGVKLTKLTPARGFSIEIGAAITVLVASQIGLPVSTTHCQVGATMGVGLVEGKLSTVNWKQFFYICVGWVFTVVFTGVLAAILYLIVTFAPSNFTVPQGDLNSNNSGFHLDYCPGNRVFVYDETEKSFRGIECSGNSLE